MTFWEVDILGVDILGVEILGVDILGRTLRVCLHETTVAGLLIASSTLSSNGLDLLSHMIILKTILLVSHTSSHCKY